ncbi:alpha/beta hydrolase [Nocardia yunnanensis]|uniref:Alpha/beta hydrolase n=1 Tax=Nocardia yunnanensis TaxID=2382165 RepID=A0A386Z4L6_9NOCA|nr:alpha/beta hydrolase [Nocardia yunnanensis]AYF72718.1 alpha/beta hydrolase [Nocardia yunnanensis]
MSWWTALFGLLLAVPIPAAADPAEPYADPLAESAPAPELHWTDCESGFSCATAQVPLDYAHPGDRSIGLAVIKLPAADPAHRIGTLFVNFGGPGRSGVQRLRDRAHWPWLFSEALRERFDLVAWDGRGIANSAPVHCFPDATVQQQFFATYPAMPGTPATEPPFFAAAKTLADGCAQRAADLLPHLSTENSARDLELLRRAVGDDKLTYHGISYGTYLGALYANMFPGRVRAMALDGSMDFRGNAGDPGSGGPHGDDLPLDTRQDVATGIAGTFDAMLDACVAAGPECAFSDGDPRAKWRLILERVRREPISWDGKRYDYGTVVAVAGELSNPAGWPQVAATLQHLYDLRDTPYVPTDVLAEAAALVRQVTEIGAGSAAGTGANTYDDNYTEAFHGVQCADSRVPRDPARYSALAATEDQRVPVFGRLGVLDTLTCAYWPQNAVHPYTGPLDRKSVPLLIINSRHDPATPLAGAITGAAELDDAHLLTVEGAGHSSMYVRSSCAEAVKREYLTAGTLPAPGASCPIDGNPFTQSDP